jgi:predicted AAA+ superfamily ATPase
VDARALGQGAAGGPARPGARPRGVDAGTPLAHLPACVGSPLSVNSLSKLLQVAHASVERWLFIFERLYVCYRVPPFGAKGIRAVRKERKLYFWDWSRVEDSGARFESMVAGHLGSRDFGSSEANTRVLPFATFCRELALP